MTVATEPQVDGRFTLTLDSYQNCVTVIEAVNEAMAELEVEWTKDAQGLKRLEIAYQRDYENCLLTLAARELEYAKKIDHKVTAAEREALCHKAVAEMSDGEGRRENLERGRAKVEAHAVRFKALDRIGSGAQSALRAHVEGSRLSGGAGI